MNVNLKVNKQNEKITFSKNQFCQVAFSLSRTIYDIDRIHTKV